MTMSALEPTHDDVLNLVLARVPIGSRRNEKLASPAGRTEKIPLRGELEQPRGSQQKVSEGLLRELAGNALILSFAEFA
jgi:hypothetical protein